MWPMVHVVKCDGGSFAQKACLTASHVVQVGLARVFGRQEGSLLGGTVRSHRLNRFIFVHQLAVRRSRVVRGSIDRRQAELVEVHRSGVCSLSHFY